jgi:hypothetical protein
MTEKLRAHDFSVNEAPALRRRRPRPWYERLVRPLRYWWSGAAGIGLAGDRATYTTGRQAVWQVARIPLSLLLFLYAACSLIAGHIVSAGVFRAFLSQVFGWQMNGGL